MDQQINWMRVPIAPMRLRVLNEFRSAPTCLAGPVFSQYYSYAQMQLAGCNPPNLCDCVVVICVSPCELSLAKSLCRVVLPACLVGAK